MTTDQTILITGGSGFAGGHLIEALLKVGYTHIHATHFGSQTQPNSIPNVTFHQLDLTDATATNALFQELQPTQIYHLASFAAVGKSFDRAASLLQNNIQLQLNVLNAAHQFTPTARLLVIGSAEEYGRTNLKDGQAIDELTSLNPTEPYGVSKVAQDL